MITLDDFTPTSERRFHADPTAVEAAERELGRFPIGYHDFITRFGEGLLAVYVRVYPPNRLFEGDNNLTEWRQRINEYWFWDDGKDVLTKQKALECVIIADTLNGDEVVFHPSQPDRLYVLPRNAEQIFIAGDGLMPAINWLLTSGTLTEQIEDRSFEPFDSAKPEE